MSVVYNSTSSFIQYEVSECVYAATGYRVFVRAESEKLFMRGDFCAELVLPSRKDWPGMWELIVTHLADLITLHIYQHLGYVSVCTAFQDSMVYPLLSRLCNEFQTQEGVAPPKWFIELEQARAQA